MAKSDTIKCNIYPDELEILVKKLKKIVKNEDSGLDSLYAYLNGKLDSYKHGY